MKKKKNIVAWRCREMADEENRGANENGCRCNISAGREKLKAENNGVICHGSGSLMASASISNGGANVVISGIRHGASKIASGALAGEIERLVIMT